MTIAESRSGQIWIGTFGGGANMLDPATGTIRQLPFGAAPGAHQRARTSPRSPKTRAAISGSARTAAASISRAPTARCVKVFRHDPNGRRLRCRRTPCMRSPSTRRTASGSRRRRRPRARRRLAGRAGVDSLRSVSRARKACRATRSTASCRTRAGDLWLSGNAGLMRFDPDTRRGQDLSSRARPAGRGVRVRRVSSVCAMAASASAGRAASISSIPRA